MRAALSDNILSHYSAMRRLKMAVVSVTLIAVACAVARKLVSRFTRPPLNAVASAGQRVRWMLDKAGDMSRLRLAPVPPSKVADDCVRVSVRYVGLNFADVCACQGLYAAPLTPTFEPFIGFDLTSSPATPQPPVAPSRPASNSPVSSLKSEPACATSASATPLWE